MSKLSGVSSSRWPGRLPVPLWAGPAGRSAGSALGRAANAADAVQVVPPRRVARQWPRGRVGALTRQSNASGSARLGAPFPKMRFALPREYVDQPLLKRVAAPQLLGYRL